VTSFNGILWKVYVGYGVEVNDWMDGKVDTNLTHLSHLPIPPHPITTLPVKPSQTGDTLLICPHPRRLSPVMSLQVLAETMTSKGDLMKSGKEHVVGFPFYSFSLYLQLTDDMTLYADSRRGRTRYHHDPQEHD
jgi:hypothetical protein